jgi:hypothetical protein
VLGTQIQETKKEEKRIHGKYNQTKQRRTQEEQANRPQESESGKAEEATRLCARIEEAESEETGARSGEAVGSR